MPTRKTKRLLIDPRLVRALAHPLRVELLDLLTEQTASPNQLKDIVGMSVSHVSYHTRALEKCDAIELVDQQKRRGATEHFYRARPRAFLGSPDWRRAPKTFLRAVSGASLQGLMDKAVKALERGNLDRDDAIVTWLPIAVDDEGKQEALDICQAATNDLAEVQKKSQQRLAKSKGKAIHYIIGVLAFEAAGS